MEKAALNELARILIVGAAALRGLADQTIGSSALISESLDKVLEIADAMESIGEALNLRAAG